MKNDLPRAVSIIYKIVSHFREMTALGSQQYPLPRSVIAPGKPLKNSQKNKPETFPSRPSSYLLWQFPAKLAVN